MKRYWILLSFLALWASAKAQQPTKKGQPKTVPRSETRIVTLPLDSQAVTTLHLRPGYVSSVRMPEEISSVVLGDPSNFRAEHSESEPRMVFIKPVSARSTETNVLITTVAGRDVSLHLVNDSNQGSGTEVDFVLDYEPPRTLLIAPTAPTFIVPDTAAASAVTEVPPKARNVLEEELRRQMQIQNPGWQGKELQLAIGRITAAQDQQMTLTFSVLNGSDEFIELMPPQLTLVAHASNNRKRKTKSDFLPTTEFKLTSRRLAPGARADGLIMFERPTFKEAEEGLFLEITQADKVDRPVEIHVPFTTPYEGGAQ